MYYKVFQDNAVVDVVTRTQWLRYQSKHGLMVPCVEEFANGIAADDGRVYHVDGLPAIPLDNMETVYPIDRAEYIALADTLGKVVAPLIEDVPILRDSIARQQAKIDYLSMMTGVDMEDDV